MRTETIINPDVERGFASFETRNQPELSHLDVERGEPLQSSDNPIIKNLLASGFQVCETVSRFHMGLRGSTGQFDRFFVARETHEFEIALAAGNTMAADGFLRIKIESPEIVRLSVFTIFPERRGKGLARLHFPRVTDGLFRAGVALLHGDVGSPYPEPADSLDINKLIRFYVRDAGFKHIGGTTIVKVSPYLGTASAKAHAPSKKRAPGTRKKAG